MADFETPEPKRARLAASSDVSPEVGLCICPAISQTSVKCALLANMFIRGCVGENLVSQLSSQDTQPPLTPRRGLDYRGSARRQPVVQAQILVVQGLLCGNSSEKVPYYREKGAGVQEKRLPKYRHCFACLKVRGGCLPSNNREVSEHSVNLEWGLTMQDLCFQPT